MDKLCTNCFYLGKEKYDNSTFKWSTMVSLAGLLFLLYSINENSILLGIGAIAYLIVGLYALIRFLINPQVCPVCDNKKTMIPLDTPRAQELIKENNLIIPSESPEQTNAPTS